MGEMQTATQQRNDGWKQDYVGGPDLRILNRTTMHNGLAVELKTPKLDGELGENQNEYLEHIRDLQYKTLVSNDYDVVTTLS